MVREGTLYDLNHFKLIIVYGPTYGLSWRTVYVHSLEKNLSSALLVECSVYVCEVKLVYSIFQWSQMDGPETNQNIYGQRIFNTGAKTIKKRKEEPLQ